MKDKIINLKDYLFLLSPFKKELVMVHYGCNDKIYLNIDDVKLNLFFDFPLKRSVEVEVSNSSDLYQGVKKFFEEPSLFDEKTALDLYLKLENISSVLV